MTQEEIKELWQKLGDIPVNEEDEIDEDFHIWEKGTDKLEIWHWFDENYEQGVYTLLYSKNNI